MTMMERMTTAGMTMAEIMDAAGWMWGYIGVDHEAELDAMAMTIDPKTVPWYVHDVDPDTDDIRVTTVTSMMAALRMATADDVDAYTCHVAHTTPQGKRRGELIAALRNTEDVMRAAYDHIGRPYILRNMLTWDLLDRVCARLDVTAVGEWDRLWISREATTVCMMYHGAEVRWTEMARRVRKHLGVDMDAEPAAAEPAAEEQPVQARRKARSYVAVVSAPNWCDHEYVVTSRSAMRAAERYGCGEDTVTIYSHTGRALSAVTWSAEDRRYYRITVD